MKLTKKGLLAIASFVLLVLQAFGLKIDVPAVNEIIAAAASVLVMLGILTDSTEKKDGSDGEPSDSPSSDTDAATGDEQETEEEQDKPADSEQDGEETEGDKQPEEHSGEDIDEDIIE